MANSAEVRAWASSHKDENGKPFALAKSRGRLSHAAVAAFNSANPENPYSGELADPTANYAPKVFGKRSGKTPNGKVWEKVVTFSDVREWARENGHTVGTRGRLHPEVAAAYLQSHKSVKVATA